MSARSEVSALLLDAARRVPRLSLAEERALVLAFHAGDRAALGRLILANVRHVVRQAGRLHGYGVPIEDLVQEGIIGLLEAAARYDPDREIPFVGYAKSWIKSATLEFVLRNWSIVRGALSRKQKILFFNVRRMRTRLMRDPSVDEATIRASIADAIGVPVRDIDLMEARLTGDVYLNAPAPWAEDGEAEIGDALADDMGGGIEDLASDALDEDDRETALRLALRDLDESERLIVQERWLTDDVAPLDALGEFLGISAVGVEIEAAPPAPAPVPAFTIPAGLGGIPTDSERRLRCH